MAYFRNNAINLLNLHYAIHSLALTGTGAFYTVFLLKAGVPVPAVLASLSAILFGRFLVRPLVLPIAKRFGLKPVLIAGTIGSGLQYPFLAEVHGIGPQLYTLVAVSAFADALYWTSYHAYFAALGDREQRGQQVGAREAIVAIIGIAAPLLAGWGLVAFGPRAAFGATAIVLVFAAVPLLWTPNVLVPETAPRAFRASLPGVLLFMADGWMACGLLFVWNLALFISLGENFRAFGGAMAVAAVAGAIGGLFLGRLIDAGHGARAAWVALSVLGGVAVLRAVSYGDPALAVAANAMGALVVCLYIPTVMTVVYNQAQRSPCVARFHIATEGGWDIGGSAALFISSLLIHFGAPLGAAILTAVLGAIASFLLLRTYYAADAAAAALVVAGLAPVDGRRDPGFDLPPEEVRG